MGRDFQHRRNLISGPHLIILVPTLRNSKSKTPPPTTNVPFSKVRLSTTKRVRNLNMELPNQNMTIMVRPLPLFGSGVATRLPPRPSGQRPRPGGKGAATKNLDEQTAKQKLSLLDSAVLIRKHEANEMRSSVDFVNRAAPVTARMQTPWKRHSL